MFATLHAERGELLCRSSSGRAMNKTVVPRSPRTVGIPVTYGLEKFRNRDGERETLAQLLADPGIRMVTIVGRRGIGKSALATKVLLDDLTVSK
jgi:predicted ribonuclease YlaK